MTLLQGLRLCVFVMLCIGLRGRACGPGEEDPKAWYDRVIRIVGGILLLLVIIGGALVQLGILR